MISQRLAAASFALLFGASLHAAALFPKPIHFVRKVEDSISGKSTTVDEYCAGNRIVTISGSKVTIADYDKQELTEIDHAAGTYSITRFDEVAKARKPAGPARATAAASPVTDGAKWRTTPLGVKGSASGRSLETVEMTREANSVKEKIEVGVDRQVGLSRDAVEALIGASYPNTRSEVHDLLLGAAAPQHGGSGRATVASASSTSDATDVYGLPSEQTMTFDIDGNHVTTHTAILSVAYDNVPPAALNIDPGAKRVESNLTRVNKELQALDQLPSSSSKP